MWYNTSVKRRLSTSKQGRHLREVMDGANYREKLLKLTDECNENIDVSLR